VGLAIVSCKKDSPDPIIPDSDDNDTIETSEVYAGVYDTSFQYFEFTPPSGIAIVWDAQNLYGSGSDSLDLDADGSHDFFIALHVLNQDSLHLLTGMPNPFPSCTISSANGFEVAVYSESYPIGQGQTSTALFADRLDFNERIDTLTNWDTNVKMWAENPGGAGTPPFGDWYTALSENYLALRIDDNHYGWLEVNASDPKDPRLVSFALQN